MNTFLSFDPLFRRSVGFDRFTGLLDNLVRTDHNVSAYPPYNIEKLTEDEYRIVMAVAGFQATDINIKTQNDTITVEGNIDQAQKANHAYLHKGIAERSFTRTFHLADYIKVVDANLDNGLLVLSLKRDVPEEAKPRMIAINTDSKAALTDKEKSSH